MEISIVIPVYNKADYISQCLDSLLKQDFGSFEIVAVNDGSTDESGAICNQMAETDSRIRHPSAERRCDGSPQDWRGGG